MRIALVAPLYERVPPKRYGGTERVVANLCDRLVEWNHQVTLFATGDSLTKAELVGLAPQALRGSERYVDPIAWHVLMMERLYKHADDFDLIHFHTDYLQFPMARRLDTPHVSTLHGRLDLPELAPLYREFAEMPLVSISLAQRKPLPGARWVGNVYHGLPKQSFSFTESPSGDYLAFLGRISPEKGLDDAIAIARASGMKLRIAAKVAKTDEHYFRREIKPLLASSDIEFLGEIGEHEKRAFLGEARALLFPICWPEPFGLVMIESLACGTPVIAYPRGSVGEILRDGESGYIVADRAAATAAVAKIEALSRRRCRQIFEERFTADTMARAYLSVYQSLVCGSQRTRPIPEVI